MNVRTLICCFVIAAGTTSACMAFAHVAPPSDESITALIDKLGALPQPASLKTPEERSAAAKQRADLLKEGLGALNLAEASVAQIDRLNTARALTPESLAAIAPRLAELAKAPTVEGARAAELRMLLMPAPAAVPGQAAADRAKAAEARTTAMLPLYIDALKHPAAMELVKSGKGEALFRQIGMFNNAQIKDAGLIGAVEKLLTTDMSLESAASLAGLTRKLAQDGAGLEMANRVKLLDKIAATGQGVLDRTGTPSEAQKALATRVADNTKLAKSTFARGELLNNPAPEVTFDWSSDGKMKSLSELKGNVVVLDFWATWCGPCIASFPKIDELVKRYEASGSPVKIIGVTSLQGRHYKQSPDRKVRAEVIDCANDPAKEYGLMPGFMKDMSMSWPVVFSPDGCFNPNYGVNGIPHLTIIDASGKVRHNNLHPSKAKEVADKIDELLKEANLKAPAEPMAVPEPKPAPAAAPKG